MARFAEIDGSGLVTNVIEAEEAFAEQIGAIPAPEDVSIGHRWNGTSYSAPTPELPPVPEMVSMRQARLAMLDAGILAQVDAAIGQSSEANKIEWEYATDLRRDHPLVAQLAPALSLSEDDVDNLFRSAAMR